MTLFGAKAATSGAALVEKAKERFDNALVRYDAWFLVLVAVLLALGATILLGMAIWCVVNQKGRFSGSWHWANGWTISMECIR
ncbi:hypothetical protein AB0K52_23675 [Glycomyces sp. NPDC049804]|uniref:hypothetical protein n=1 Tax=Glycomyces sp. NPDC049804 TaxID=3154363 RepID=UPI0034156CEF